MTLAELVLETLDLKSGTPHTSDTMTICTVAVLIIDIKITMTLLLTT